MLDLVILLSIALAITALLGLLLAGFVWLPWLVGVLLVALLVALIKLSPDEPELELPELESELGLAGPQDSTDRRRFNPARGLKSSAAPTQPAPTSPTQNANSPASNAPNMVYRGAKYRQPKAVADASNQKGLYRGQPWQR